MKITQWTQIMGGKKHLSIGIIFKILAICIFAAILASCYTNKFCLKNAECPCDIKCATDQQCADHHFIVDHQMQHTQTCILKNHILCFDDSFCGHNSVCHNGICEERACVDYCADYEDCIQFSDNNEIICIKKSI